MKKIAGLILLLVYSVSVSGAAFHVHYCGDNLQSISLAGEGHEGCCCSKKEMKKNCCKDKEVVFKSFTSALQSPSLSCISKITFSTPIIFQGLSGAKINILGLYIIRSGFSPPDRIDKNSLRVLNCVFRI